MAEDYEKRQRNRGALAFLKYFEAHKDTEVQKLYGCLCALCSYSKPELEPIPQKNWAVCKALQCCSDLRLTVQVFI